MLHFCSLYINTLNIKKKLQVGQKKYQFYLYARIIFPDEKKSYPQNRLIEKSGLIIHLCHCDPRKGEAIS